MKPSRPDAEGRKPKPPRPLEERSGKSPIMGRGDLEKKLERFKGKSRRTGLRPAHVPQPKPEKNPSSVAPKTASRPATSSKSAKPSSSASSKPASSHKTPASSSRSAQSGSGARGKTAPKSSRSRARGAPRFASLQKTVSRWLDDTKLALESPHANTLENLGARGGWKDGLGYVASSAVLTALLSLRAGWKGMLAIAVLTVMAYAIFVYATHYAVRKQDGDGKIGSVAYATALFWAPLAPFTALLPFVFGGAWIPAAILVQVLATFVYALRVLNGTVWLSYNGQMNALTAGIAASSLTVLVLGFTLFSPLLKG